MVDVHSLHRARTSNGPPPTHKRHEMPTAQHKRYRNGTAVHAKAKVAFPNTWANVVGVNGAETLVSGVVVGYATKKCAVDWTVGPDVHRTSVSVRSFREPSEQVATTTTTTMVPASAAAPRPPKRLSVGDYIVTDMVNCVTQSEARELGFGFNQWKTMMVRGAITHLPADGRVHVTLANLGKRFSVRLKRDVVYPLADESDEEAIDAEDECEESEVGSDNEEKEVAVEEEVGGVQANVAEDPDDDEEEEEPLPEEVDVTEELPVDPEAGSSVSLQGIVWTQQSVTVDARLGADTTGRDRKSRISIPHGVDAIPSNMTPYQSLLVSLPPADILFHDVNQVLRSRGDDAVDNRELRAFFGVLIVMGLSPDTPRKLFWSKPSENEIARALEGPKLGNFMKRNRFNEIFSAARGVFDDEPIWDASQRLMTTAFDHAKTALTVGEFYVVDESMIGNQGRQTLKSMYERGKMQPGSSPPQNYVERKPVNNGHEVTTSGPGDVVFLAHGEYVSNPIPDTDFLEYPPSVQKVLRQCKKYFGTWRTIVVDSGYCSVKLAEALFKNRLYMVGAVKTHSAIYPVKELASMMSKMPEIGSSAYLVADIGKCKAIAVAWRISARTVGYYLSTRFTTTDGAKTAFRRWSEADSEVKRYVVKRPLICEMYHTHFNMVDRHNRYRQHAFGIARLRTRHWRTKIFLFVSSVLVTNAWGLYIYDKRTPESSKKALSRHEFSVQLATEIFQKDTDASFGPSSSPVASYSLPLTPLRILEEYRESEKPQLRCGVCNMKTSFCCTACLNLGSTEKPNIVACCQGCGDDHQCGIRRKRRKSST